MCLILHTSMPGPPHTKLGNGLIFCFDRAKEHNGHDFKSIAAIQSKTQATGTHASSDVGQDSGSLL